MITDPFAKLKSAGQLPSPPSVAVRLLELVENQSASFDDLAGVISTDPALCAKILKYVNSPLVSLGFHGSTLNEAIARIGMRGTQMIALSFSLVSQKHRHGCPSFDFDAFWSRSLACAVATRCLSRRTRRREAGESFVTGLVSRIGQLVLATAMHEEYEPVLSGQVRPELPLLDREREVLGFDHIEIGARVLEDWKLPREIWMTVRDTSQKNRGVEWKETGASILSLGDSIAGFHADKGGRTGEGLIVIQDHAAAWLDLGAEELRETLVEIGQEWSVFGNMLEIATGQLPELERIEREAAEYRDVLRIASEMEIKTLRTENEQLTDLANHDGLTGLLNRGAFNDAFPKALDLARKSQKPVALLMIDADHFKSVNDTHGHPAGDAILKHLARVLEETARKRDTVFRYGGEEFAILAADIGRDAALALAESFRTAVAAEPVACDGVGIKLTVSVGIAWAKWPEQPATSDELLACADQRLYEAKRSGRNRCVIDPVAERMPKATNGFLSRLGRAFAGADR